MKIESKDVSGASSLTPTFTERTITGTARVQNNRTMMLASVTQDVQSNGRQGLPFLGGLPILGRFFTSPTKDNRQVDIVIAVTPRVLRAPAVTPRDEEMRPSGTLQSPTTGSIATMMQETEREEQIAAARKIPKDVVVQVPGVNVPTTYEPAKAVAADQSGASVNKTNDTGAAAQVTTVSQSGNSTAPQTQTAALTAPDKPPVNTNGEAVAAQNDSAMPQPKAAPVSSQTGSGAPQRTDVATAVQSLVSSSTGVSATNVAAKQDATVTPVVEQLAPKSDKSDAATKSSQPTTSVIELSLASEKSEMKAGEKRQLALQVRSDAPLGLAVITLRFDPKVIKITSVSAGSLFANSKVAPTLTQSIDEHGMLLISLAPAAGSPVNAEGALLNVEIEALSAGDSDLAFDLSNVHLVASDGRTLLLQIEPIKLTVK